MNNIDNHRNKQIELMREHQKKVLRSTLLATGAGMVLVGLCGLFMPVAFIAMINTGSAIRFGVDDINFYCAILTTAGLADIAAAMIVFKDRKTR